LALLRLFLFLQTGSPNEPTVMAESALQGALQIIIHIGNIKNEVEVNVQSANFLAERLESLSPGIEKLLGSGADDSLSLNANKLYQCCQEARDFIVQFTRKDGHWLFDKARKAYNRERDRDTMESILKRINMYSAGLHLGVSIDIKDSIDQLFQLFQEDTQKFQQTLAQMQQDAAQRDDTQEKQHQELRSAQEEIKRYIIALHSAKGIDVQTDMNGGPSSLEGKDVFERLPSIDSMYQMALPCGEEWDSDEEDASLGSGAYGEVFCMRGKVDGKLYAVKFIKVKNAAKAGIDKQELLMEGSNMQRLTHQNIVRMWNQCQRKKGKIYCLVMDFADKGTVHEYMVEHGRVPTPQIRKWITQLCAGLHHMHRECKMLHRDLKPQNLLLSTDSVTGELGVRIADLGLASLYQSALSRSKAGTHQYMSPEKVPPPPRAPRPPFPSLHSWSFCRPPDLDLALSHLKTVRQNLHGKISDVFTSGNSYTK
jgi:hypothetical protein